MSKTLKLVGLNRYGHNALRDSGGELLLLRKNDVIVVDDTLGDHLLERFEQITEEDVRYTFVETTEKPKYDLRTVSTQPVANVVAPASASDVPTEKVVSVSVTKGDAPGADHKVAAAVAKKTQRRGRTAG